MYRSIDWTELRTSIVKQGAKLLPDFLDKTTVAAIERDIEPWRRQVNFNDIYGSAIAGPNRWIYHLGIASLNALRLALDEKVLDLMDSIFGEPAILAEFSYQEKVRPDPNRLKMHSDMDGGILIFYYLSGVDDELGCTRYLPGTHELGGSLQSEHSIFIDERLYAPRMGDIQEAKGAPGTALVFDQDIWHDLLPVTKAGRRAIWCLYQPRSRTQYAVDHLYRQTFLAALNDRQRRAFGIGAPAFTRGGSLDKVGLPLSIEHFKFAVKYLMWHRYVGSPPPAKKLKSIARPVRIRAKA